MRLAYYSLKPKCVLSSYSIGFRGLFPSVTLSDFRFGKRIGFCMQIAL